MNSSSSSTISKKPFLFSKRKMASRLAVCLFLLMQFFLLIALLIVFFVLQHFHPIAFSLARTKLHLPFGIGISLLLFFSSLTMSLALISIVERQKRTAMLNYFLTALLALFYFFLRFLEWQHLDKQSLLSLKSNENYQALFFNFFLIFNFLHAFYIFVALALLLWLYLKTRQNEYDEEYYHPVENVGLFWHYATLTWILLFPILYLLR